LIQFRPTLIVGLGGSGTFVTRRVKKRLMRLVEGELPPSSQILAFDTDVQRELPMLDLLSPTEFHRISDFNGDERVTPSALARDPEIAAFWKYRQLRPGYVRDGAKQRPPVGRLAFFVHCRRIAAQMQNAITRMFQRTSSYAPPPNVAAVDVYLIGSSCGGTGAGMFFDAALLARHLVKDSTRTPMLQAHVLLPSCFTGNQVNLESLQTNAYAFLKTLEAVQSGPVPAVDYPSVRIDGVQGALFRRVHLLSGVDMAGVRAQDLQAIFEKIALQLDLEISSAQARDMRSATDNYQADFNLGRSGRLAVYSSYGTEVLSGTLDFGRLTVLPAFIGTLVQALSDPTQSAPAGAIDNQGFNEASAILSDDNSALALLPDYDAEVQRLMYAEDPVRAAGLLVARIDSLTAGLSFPWLTKLDGLTEAIRTTASKLLAGRSGVPSAAAYMEAAQKAVDQLTTSVYAIEQQQYESAENIVQSVDRWFLRNDARRSALLREGVPYLRSQCLLRIRRTLALKIKPRLGGTSNDLAESLKSLRQFGVTARVLVDSTERQTEEVLAQKQNTLGPNAVAIDVDEVRSTFKKSASELATRFFVYPPARKALARMAEATMAAGSEDSWTGNFLQIADDFLATNLSANVAVPTDWPRTAAERILSCRPMVQFTASDDGELPSSIATGRVFRCDDVRRAVQEQNPDSTVSLEESREPGSLEISEMVLNFALHQLQEVRLIEEGYRRFAGHQPEPTENRFAWRGPESFWRKLQNTELLPLSPQKQDLARALAFLPPPQLRVVAVQQLNTYVLDGIPLDVDSEQSWYRKYRALSERLVDSGRAEEILRDWYTIEPTAARAHLATLMQSLESRVADSRGRCREEADWELFVNMLLAELEAARDASRKLPV